MTADQDRPDWRAFAAAILRRKEFCSAPGCVRTARHLVRQAGEPDRGMPLDEAAFVKLCDRHADLHP